MDSKKFMKLAALAIAIILWFYVSVEENPLSRQVYEVPIQVENLDADKVATLSQETVNVRVLGRQERLNEINADKIEAYIDLDGAKTGNMQAEVKLKLPSELYFAQVKPKTVNVSVDQREGESMEVDVIDTGMLPNGVSLDELSVDPGTVFVSGTPEALRQVARVGVPVELGDIMENSKKERKVQLYDFAGNVINSTDLKVYPEKVTLTTKVRSVEIQKSIPVQVVLTGKLPEGVSVDSVTVNPSAVMVQGLPQTLAKIDAIKTAAISLEDIHETTTKTVKLKGRNIQGPRTVSVTISVSNTSISASDDSGASYTRILPIAVTGDASGAVQTDTQLVMVTYHMEDGYQDAGDELSAFVSVDSAPEAPTMVQVQFSKVEGLVIDSGVPSTVTVSAKG